MAIQLPIVPGLVYPAPFLPPLPMPIPSGVNSTLFVVPPYVAGNIYPFPFFSGVAINALPLLPFPFLSGVSGITPFPFFSGVSASSPVIFI